MVRLLLLLCSLAWLAPAAAFTLHKSEGAVPGRTLLVIGGVHGDEPGGFLAASLLATHYTITKGQVWVVPNLNFESIIWRSRGIHGDMNRKFAGMHNDDPDLPAVQEVKTVIADPQVAGVLNLHDGSGFYRPKGTDAKHSPSRWGQSVIIDQPMLAGLGKLGELGRIATETTAAMNGRLQPGDEEFRVKDTMTRWEDEEMAKTLTFFAIQQGKPAFAIEASKEFGAAERVYYHLLAIESFMEKFGIEFERHFDLNPTAIATLIDSQPRVALYDSRIVLDFANARDTLSYLPMKRGGPLEFVASTPLVALVAKDAGYEVHYGNNRIARILPQYFDFDESIDSVALEVDGNEERVPFGSIVPVHQQFRVLPLDDYRVNLIGFAKAGADSEDDIEVARDDFLSHYSVDRDGQVYRVEVYHHGKFEGMVLMDFSQRDTAANPSLWFTGRELVLERRAGHEVQDENLSR